MDASRRLHTQETHLTRQAYTLITMADPLKKIKQKLQEEITALEHELSIELPKEIAVARAHGDLSEDAEYKFAKERQGFVNARIAQLKKRMGDLGMLNLSNIPKDRAGYGNIGDRKSTRLNSSHVEISYAVFCLKKKKSKSLRLY